MSNAFAKSIKNELGYFDWVNNGRLFFNRGLSNWPVEKASDKISCWQVVCCLLDNYPFFSRELLVTMVEHCLSAV